MWIPANSLKPTAPFIHINGHRYDKVPDEKHLRVSFYRNLQKKKQVRIYWSDFSAGFVVLGAPWDPIFWNADLNTNLIVPDESQLDPYFTPEEDAALDNFLDRFLSGEYDED